MKNRILPLLVSMAAGLMATAQAPGTITDPAKALALGNEAYAAGDYTTALSMYRRANTLDPTVAADNLGLMYENGIACTPSADRAADVWRAQYKKTSSRGVQFSALRHLARLHRPLYTAAEFADVRNLRAAATLKPTDAGRRAAMMKQPLMEVERPGQILSRYAMLCRAVDGDNVDALCDLVDIFTRQRPSDYDKGLALYYIYPDTMPNQQRLLQRALTNLERAAGHGNVKALCKLGAMYKWGIYYQKDLARALDYYMKAADNGSTEAMLEAGFLEDEFFHFPQANRLLLRAVEMGAVDPRAFYCLGNMFLQGNGCTQDREQAIEWYTRAVECAPADNQFAKNSARQLGEIENRK